jgi:predicted enzyme related to lactoylglutathione lyase
MANKVKTEEQPAANLLRMDNVAIVVQDLDAAIQFFAELGLVLEGRMQVEGDWVNRVVGLTGVRSEIAMMRTPDGHSRLELTFAVEDIDGVLARLRKHGAELIGKVAQYEQMYRLCYLRGPEGIIVALAQRIGERSLCHSRESGNPGSAFPVNRHQVSNSGPMLGSSPTTATRSPGRLRRSTAINSGKRERSREPQRRAVGCGRRSITLRTSHRVCHYKALST